MKIYLDNCAFNRPFDNQLSIRIRIEAEAKLFIQHLISIKKLELVWSYILDFENDQNPYAERQLTIAKWKQYSIVDIEESKSLLKLAHEILLKGIRPKDALHIASAIFGGAKYFLTTDDGILKKSNRFKNIVILNPTDFIRLIDE